MCPFQLYTFLLFQALILVLPMLGFGYIITLVPPDRDSITYYTVFQIGRSVLLSCQVQNTQSGV